MAHDNVKKGKNEIIYIPQAWIKKYLKNLFTIHILQVLKSFYKNKDPLSKNCPKIYVFSPFLKPVKDGDLHKCNGSEFHSLGAHGVLCNSLSEFCCCNKSQKIKSD